MRIIKVLAVASFFIAVIMFVGIIDGGAAAGIHHEKMSGTVKVVVTLENGHTYVAECYDGEVTVNTHFSNDPTKWDIVKW